ncbi:unnamed protein product [Symbiodinium sp. CCMP2592]|nr:unnamed protein product [Symbiodinium sp. CCMP2592]
MLRLQYCFPDTYPVGYGKCCRDPGSPWYKAFMEPACWDKEFGITFENCCVFEYGPRLRGLPFTSFAEPSALVHFDVPKTGRLRLRSGYDVLQTEEFSSFWPGGWIFARLLADLHGAVRDAEEFGWEEGAAKLRPMVGGDLQILDVSCGLGLSSIAAARAGHNVTSTEISQKVLRLLGQNAQRNGVQLRLWRWNLLAEIVPAFPKSGYHLCLLDLGWLNAKDRAMQLMNGRGISVSLEEEWPSVESVLRKTLETLGKLGGCQLHAFIGRTKSGDAVVLEAAEVEFDTKTRELLRALDALDAVFGTSAGVSAVTVSPLGWLENVGWTPPIWHHLILW